MRMRTSIMIEMIFLLTSVSPRATEFLSKATPLVTLTSLERVRKNRPTSLQSY